MGNVYKSKFQNEIRRRKSVAKERFQNEGP